MDAATVFHYIRDVLVILTCLVILIGAYRIESALSNFKGFLDNGDTVQESNAPIECWDPGGGEVCAPGGEDGI